MCAGLVAVTAADAAAPKVAGTYAMISWHLCQLVVTAPRTTMAAITGTAKTSIVAGITKQSGIFSTPGGGTASALTNVTVGTGQAIVQVDTKNNTVATGFEQNLSGGKGIISMRVGTVTFPSTASSSGNVSISTVEVLGHAMRNLTIPSAVGKGDNVGFARNPASGVSTTTGTFAILSETTLKVGTTIYDISVADIATNGVAGIINILRRPATNDYCLDGSTLTKK